MSQGLFIAAREPGLEAGMLPTWSDHGDGAVRFDATQKPAVERVDIPEVPGAFQLLNILTDQECDDFIARAEEAGFHEDSPVSLPHSVRHNENLNWVVSEEIDQTLWARSKDFIPETVGAEQARGINARFRFYRYGEGDYFKPHRDGAWPGSRVIDGQLIANAYPDLYSQYTYLILLSDDYDGGHTQFFVSDEDANKPTLNMARAKVINVRTPKGAVLCFPHGMHPLHCLHGSEPISRGVKYIIRTDILFG